MTEFVFPAQAGIQCLFGLKSLDSRLRGNDGELFGDCHEL